MVLNNQHDVLNLNLKEISVNKQNFSGMSNDVFFPGDEPFKHLVLKNVFDDEFLLKVKGQVLSDLEFCYKNNDLFSFNQSKALSLTNKSIENSAYLKQAIKVLYSEDFRTVLQDVFEVELYEDVIDLSASIYKKGDYLLCHNDKIQEFYEGIKHSERTIAFILYLVEKDWSDADGGYLDLMKTGKSSYPTEIARRLLPQWNSIALFKIFDGSYHQVSQVLKERDRVSLVGWFHGPTTKKTSHNEATKQFFYKQVEETTRKEDFKNIFTSSYLETKSILKINRIFMEESCIELQKFLSPALHSKILNELEKLDVSKWTDEAGDLSFRKNKYLPSSNEPKALQLFKTQTFVEYLSKLTGLSLKKFIHGKIRKYTKTDYSMVNDNYIEPVGLDLSLYFFNGTWDDRTYGGTTHYIADTETLISRTPSNNTLYLVYRDEEVHRFVKLLKNECEKNLYEYCVTYSE